MLLVSLAALVMGMLNAKHVSTRRPWRRVILISVSIIAGVAIGYWLDPHFGARSLVGFSNRGAGRRCTAIGAVDSLLGALATNITPIFSGAAKA
jgi:hypothetical protein